MSNQIMSVKLENLLHININASPKDFFLDLLYYLSIKPSKLEIQELNGHLEKFNWLEVKSPYNQNILHYLVPRYQYCLPIIKQLENKYGNVLWQEVDGQGNKPINFLLTQVKIKKTKIGQWLLQSGELPDNILVMGCENGYINEIANYLKEYPQKLTVLDNLKEPIKSLMEKKLLKEYFQNNLMAKPSIL